MPFFFYFIKQYKGLCLKKSLHAAWTTHFPYTTERLPDLTLGPLALLTIREICFSRVPYHSSRISDRYELLLSLLPPRQATSG